MESDDKTKYITFHSTAKAETVINESDIDYLFESNYNTTNLLYQTYKYYLEMVRVGFLIQL